MLKSAIEERAKEILQAINEGDVKIANDEKAEEVAVKIAADEIHEAVSNVQAEKELAYQIGMAQGAGFAAGMKAAMEDFNEK